MLTSKREKLARWAQSEDQFRRRDGKFWDELSSYDRASWLMEADRLEATLAHFGLKVTALSGPLTE